MCLAAPGFPKGGYWAELGRGCAFGVVYLSPAIQPEATVLGIAGC